jgi:hypothetical protein
MANRAIKDNFIKTKSDEDVKKYKAYAMEESRLKKAKEMCETTRDCSEYQRLGGENRLREVENLVHHEQKKDVTRRKTQKDTNPNNMYQQEDPTAVSTTKVTKSADHSGKTNKILSNNEAMNESIDKEISSIRYLIEYMNNNNKKQKL